MPRLVPWCLTLALAGCAAQRSLTLPPAPPPLQVSRPLPAKTWELGAVSTSIRVRATNGPTTVDSTPLREQLEHRLKQTLAREISLGVADADARYVVDLDVDLDEEHGLGKGVAAGLATETGVLTAGAIAGAVVGGLAVPGLGAPLGATIGMVLSSPGAIASAMAFDLNGVSAEYRATVTLRRRADGTTVASRRVVAPWTKDFSSFRAEEQLAVAAGEAVAGLEKKVLEALHELLLDATRTPG